MSTGELLLLSTYPIEKPRHGGQLRARALARAYAASGFNVTPLAVVEKGSWHRTTLGRADVEFPADDPKWFIDERNIPLSSDLRSGTFAAQYEPVYQRILASLPRRLSAIHLEQPWLLPLAQRLLSEPAHSKAALVYGSQNVEAPLRESIFEQMGIKGCSVVVERIDALERDASRAAALSLAVAPSDQEALRAWGAQRVLMAPNGIDAWEASGRALADWSQRLRGVRRFALFVGSAHPPNFAGFFRAFGDALGFIPPDCRVVVAGSVTAHIQPHYQATRFNSLNLSRLVFAGELEEDELAALKTLASAFVLPVYHGGGSNIKTAEALLSGKPVVATSVSMRGFGPCVGLPEVAIADDPEEFRACLCRVLAPGAEPPAESADARKVREELLWSRCLAPVAPALHSLIAEQSPSHDLVVEQSK